MVRNTVEMMYRIGAFSAAHIGKGLEFLNEDSSTLSFVLAVMHPESSKEAPHGNV